MNSKAAILIASLAAVAVIGTGVGVYVASSDKNEDKTSYSTVATTAVKEYIDSQNDKNNETTVVIENDTKESESSNKEYEADSDNKTTSAKLIITETIDRTTNERVSPSVVFGKESSSCYVKLSDNGSFDIFLGSNAPSKYGEGTYKNYGSTIGVSYENGTEDEYPVFYRDNGDIDYIIVNYGDFDVYFTNVE